MVFDERTLTTTTASLPFPREEWEASPDFDDAIQDRLREEEQQKRETAFLDHQGDCFALYQSFTVGRSCGPALYLSGAPSGGGRVPPEGNYDLVYTAPLTGQDDALQQLDQLWHQFNMEHQADYHSPSMSISDIVALKQGGVLSCHYVDQYAFSELPGFFSGRNPPAAEDSLEQNDNQLDGILNNTPAWPSWRPRSRPVNRFPSVDLAPEAVPRSRRKKKKSVVAQLRNAPARTGAQEKNSGKKAQKGSDNH